MSMAWEPDRRSNFFFSPPAHLCAVTYMTEISLIVTLNKQFNSTQSFTCIEFYDLSAWGGCWFVVFIRRFIYKFLNVCPFDYTAVAVSGKVGP